MNTTGNRQDLPAYNHPSNNPPAYNPPSNNPPSNNPPSNNPPAYNPPSNNPPSNNPPSNNPPSNNPPSNNPPVYNPPASGPNPPMMQMQQPQYVNMVPGYPPYPTYQYPQNNTVFIQDAVPVVTTQTTMVAMPLPNYVSSYVGYSIFNMIWCCFPLGLAALIFSCKTQNCNQRGDAAGARGYSRTSFILNNIALGLGIAINVTWITLVVYFVVINKAKYSSSYSSSYNSGYYDYYYYLKSG